MWIPATITMLPKKEAWSVQKRWLEVFCQNVHRETGKWISGGFMWHTFTKYHQPHCSGHEAREQFNEQPFEPYCLFNEDLSFCGRGIDPPFPQIPITPVRSLEDWYLIPSSQQWTFVVTHEQDAFFSRCEHQ